MGQAEAIEIRISGKVPGRIASYRFHEGDKVKQGDTLVFLDTPDVQAKFQQAEAAMNAAQAQNQQCCNQMIRWLHHRRCIEIKKVPSRWTEDCNEVVPSRVQNLF